MFEGRAEEAVREETGDGCDPGNNGVARTEFEGWYGDEDDKCRGDAAGRCSGEGYAAVGAGQDAVSVGNEARRATYSLADFRGHGIGGSLGEGGDQRYDKKWEG